jgi:hypothetical protein
VAKIAQHTASGYFQIWRVTSRRAGSRAWGLACLKNCRQFYRLYPGIRQSLAGELGTIPVRPEIRQSAIGEFDPGPPPVRPEHLLRLSWTHFIEMIRIDDPLKRAFYEAECLEGNWSIRQLQRQIGSLLYERTGLSTDKESVVGRASSQDLPPSIAALLRDPSVLEFAGLAERPSYSEADLWIIYKRSSWNWAPAFVLKLDRNESPSATSTTLSTWYFTIDSFAATYWWISRSGRSAIGTRDK